MGNPVPANLAANAGKGRKRGVPNKTTMMAKAVIANAFDRMGGVDALVTWATKNDDNRGAFYKLIYPKLLPLQVTGEDGDAIKVVNEVRRTIVRP